MNKKSFTYFLIVFFIGGAIILTTFTSIDKSSLKSSINTTSSFVKERVNNYNNIISNDRVKSLVRLLDKSEILAEQLEKSSFDEKDFLDEQRLSGYIVLDHDLNLVYQSEDYAYYMFSEYLDLSYIKEIVDYKEKTYSERVLLGNDTYDFTVINYNNGLLLTYVIKDESTLNDLALSNIFLGFPFEKDGIVVISDGEKVVSTNSNVLYNKSLTDLSKTYNFSFSDSGDGITCLKTNSSVYYGAKDNIGDYDLYLFFKENQVFQTRNTVFAIYLVLMLFVLLLSNLYVNEKEKQALLLNQKRLNTINAIATAYVSITLIDLKKMTVETIKSSGSSGYSRKSEVYDKEKDDEYIRKTIAAPYLEETIAFCDMNTINERIKGLNFLSNLVETIDGVWLYTMIIPQSFDALGNVNAVLVVNKDVTAEKRKEIEQDKALRMALINAESANKAKTTFLNSISHDIRTPMNAIIGFTALATTHIDSKELVKDYLNKISISGQHLLSLINDVLDMSRIESGVVKLDEKEVHLPDVLKDLRAIILGSIHAKQQELYIDTQDIVHEDIIADKLRLNQVLLNIASNATKFTPVGGTISIKVCEKPCAKEGYATFEFRIKDNGAGMSKEYIKHIFDPFSREKSSTKSGIQGTGLGMAICKNIVDMMSGTIEVNSEVGKGSEFIVTLIFKISDKVITYKPIDEFKKARALVVDDDATTCINVSKLLKQIEMVPEWTTSGSEAVLKAKEAHDDNDEFKVYIIDWLMPDMNGIETVRRIRKHIGYKTPIIILSAYDWADVEDEAKEAGVTAFISKPIFMSELREVLTKQVKEDVVLKTNKRHAGKKVLLVEDNDMNREIASCILSDAGLIVDGVSDGCDAVERMSKAKEDQYDVIFMDVQMPRLDGYSATKQIRTLPNNKIANIPIIAMTANAFKEDRLRAIDAGMNDYIAKPIDIETILECLDKIFY